MLICTSSMPSFRFYLNNKPNSKSLDLIMAHISYKINGKFKKLPISTGLFIEQKYWLQKKQLVSKSHYLSDRLNNDLDKEKRCIESILLEAKTAAIQELQFADFFKNKWNNRLNPAEQAWQKETIWKVWDDYIEANKNNWAANTLKNKNTDYNTLKDFEFYDKQPVTWESINMDFYTRFLNYCYDVKEFKNSSVGRTIKGFKTMMEWAFNNNRHQNLIYKKRDFAKPAYFKTIISFTPQELWEFYSLKLNITDSIIRDALCFSCFTGLRYSDIKLLTWANVKEGWLHVVTEKTTSEIVIPLNHEATEIIAKYKNQTCLIPLPSDQKCNKAIHKILKRYEFNRSIEIIDVIRKEKQRKLKPLHEVFTFHCGKKTFITLFKKFGGDTNVAMSLTGNTDENVIRSSYETIDNELKQQQMDSVWTTWRQSVSNP